MSPPEAAPSRVEALAARWLILAEVAAEAEADFDAHPNDLGRSMMATYRLEDLQRAVTPDGVLGLATAVLALGPCVRALERYGEHRLGCGTFARPVGGCTCGFAIALSAARAACAGEGE